MWLNKKLGHRTRLAAFMMTLALAFCFIVPLTIIGTSSAENFEKISGLVTDALQGDTASVGSHLEGIPYAGDFLARQWRGMTADKETFLKVIEEYAGMTNEGLVKLGASIARGMLDLTLGVLIAYFFFRHGTRAAVRISNLIDRFGGAYGQHLLDVSKNTLIGVVYGMLGTALAQGALAAFGFWLVDVPGASFLGLMTFFLSFTPIGPPLIWVPATLWLYSEGHLYSAVFMGLWGLLAVSTIDNVLRPYFISLRGNLPFLLVLLGVIGGIFAFGFIGIFIGPTLLALAYVSIYARRSRAGRRYISLEIVGELAGAAAGGGTVGGLASASGADARRPAPASRIARWRRHIPPLLTLFALAALIFAIARPQAVILLPSRVETIMLALDNSGSMRATDVKPTRMGAAQAAARAFMEDQPRQMRVGVVGVAAAAAVVQSPTTNREDVAQAIDRLQPQRGTALGSGIIISLATLLPGSGINVEKLISEGQPQAAAAGPPKPPEPKKAVVPSGSNTASAIVLVTDGQSNTGPDPIKAAEIAAEHGVRVFTVGIGTPEGTTLSADGFSLRVRLDEEQLKKIAAKTSGEYFRAGSAADLKKIYKYIGASMAMEKSQMTEVTALFIALGALLAMLSGLLSMAWYNRIL